jgi:hypothetical protein
MSTILVLWVSEEPIAGELMSTIPAKTIERKRNIPAGWNRAATPPASQGCNAEEICRFAPGDRT